MELAQSLFLNEEAFEQVSEAKKHVFVYEWLRFLDRALPDVKRQELRSAQPRLLKQLLKQVSGPLPLGPPSRELLAKCLATVFSVGDTSELFSTINKCNDILKNKDDSPAFLPAKLAAISIIGAIYAKLGRMVGRSYEETTAVLLRALRNGESQIRASIMSTFSHIVAGLGSAGQNIYKDVYKSAKSCLGDRVMCVRSSACACLMALARESFFGSLSDAEVVVAAAVKALESSTYVVRTAAADLIGEVLATAANPARTLKGVHSPQMIAQASARAAPLGECLEILALSFLRGGGGFLKGSAASGAAHMPRESRAGVAYAYVAFAQKLGPLWLERNLPVWIRHVVELTGQMKTLNQPETLFVRRCVAYILRGTLGRLLTEKVQHSACREMGYLVAEQINRLDVSMDGSGSERAFASTEPPPHCLLVALDELSCLASQLGTMVTPLFTEASGIMEPVFAVLLHPCSQVKLSGAWCLRCIAQAVPSLTSPLMDRCLSRLEHLKQSPDALLGYSLALAALTAAAQRSVLGIPEAKAKQVFQLGEELLRTAVQQSRLTPAKTQAGWTLLTGLMTLGSHLVGPHVPKLLLLWRNAFPRSAKEGDNERLRGDGFTWQVTLESRCGALASTQAFVTYCPELVTEDVTRRLLQPVESGLTMFQHMPAIVNDNGVHLRPLAAQARMRLYSTLQCLKPSAYDAAYPTLLRELAAEFALTDRPVVTVTSLLKSMCHADEALILGESSATPDQFAVECCLEEWTACAGMHVGQGEPVVGALEHDPLMSLISRPGVPAFGFSGSLTTPNSGVAGPPTPLHLNVAVIDAGVGLFGKIFPLVPGKHRLQIMNHFSDCIKQSKGLRQTAIQVNVVTAFLCSMRHQVEEKVGFDTDQLRTSAINLTVGLMSSNLPALRCAAAEAMGRVAQVVGDPHFVASLAQSSFDRLKSCRDIVNRTGFSLALGCLHRYVGGLGSAHHLSTSISVLTALYHDISSPEVQLWAIHAVSLIADSGGPMFRGYVDPSLAVSLKLLLTVPASMFDVHRCIGRLISSLITCVGPELQSNIGSIVATRNNFVAACNILASHEDPYVVAEAAICLQQLHIFAPKHLKMAQLVPELCKMLQQTNLTVRRAAVSCLRQLAQKETEDLHEQTLNLVPKGLNTTSLNPEPPLLPDSGLEGALFSLLDDDTDQQLRDHVQETLMSLCQKLCSSNLLHWLSLCKGILATVSTDLQSLHQEEKVVRITESATAGGEDADQEEDSLSGLSAGSGVAKETRMSRWPTRVFAMEMVRKIIVFCSSERAHFDVELAKELTTGGGGSASVVTSPEGPYAAAIGTSVVDYLVLHLSDLVRVAFMAATSDTTELRLSGLACLHDVIDRFAEVPEPEFPGHVILEQFQAQVSAALRPAFAPDTPSNVTAAACEVCSAWIGSGVARDLNDLRRVHQLLVSSLAKIKSQESTGTAQVYSENAATLEKLAVLRAWADVYIVASKQASGLAAKIPIATPDENAKEIAEPRSETLLELVLPELPVLVPQWLQALEDLALTNLPQDIKNRAPLPSARLAGGAYAIENGASSIPPVLLATATWLQSTNLKESNNNDKDRVLSARSKEAEESMESDKLFLILGICIEALCNPKIVDDRDIEQHLEAIRVVLDCESAHVELMADPQVAIEILNVMYRIILTNSSLKLQRLCLDVLDKILDAVEGFSAKRTLSRKLSRKSSSGQGSGDEIDIFELTPGRSVIFAALEVCLCALVRHIPDLYPGAQRAKAGFTPGPLGGSRGLLTAEGQNVVTTAMRVMARIPQISRNPTETLPITLFLLTSIIRFTSQVNRHDPGYRLRIGQVNPVAAVGLQTLKTVISKVPKDPETGQPDKTAISILQSALLTVLDWGKTPEAIDPVVTMLSLAVFVISAPRSVTYVPSKIKQMEVALFRSCLETPDTSVMVKYKALQSLQSVFQLKDRPLAMCFFKHTGPLILKILQQAALKRDDGSAAASTDGEGEGGSWEHHVLVVPEAVKCLEVVIQAGLGDDGLNVQVMAYLFDSTLSILERIQEDAKKPGSPSQCERQSAKLEQELLRRVRCWATTHRSQLQALLRALPEAKPRLERVIMTSSQQRSASVHFGANLQSSKADETGLKSPDPTIKLTMDFSAFK